MSHTPGPWRFLPGLTNHNIWKADLILARVFKFEKDLETSDANARLIAAAPELLQACQEFVEHIKSLGTDTEKCRYLSMALNCRAGDLIEQAIAKATGEQK